TEYVERECESWTNSYLRPAWAKSRLCQDSIKNPRSSRKQSISTTKSPSRDVLFVRIFISCSVVSYFDGAHFSVSWFQSRGSPGVPAIRRRGPCRSWHSYCPLCFAVFDQIGRASCRERLYISVV